MQTRVAFNSGEFSPEMICRSDLDQYGRACSVLENWQVSQMGGIKRRKGMRFVMNALSEDSRLIPYIYSYADAENSRFLVEIAGDTVRVISMAGEVAATFKSTAYNSFYYKPDELRYFQQNKLLLITSRSNPPMALEFDGDETWSFHRWEFKHMPWRHVNELRDWPIEISKVGDEIEVIFPDDVPFDESVDSVHDTDYLRASFWMEQKEELSIMNDILKEEGSDDIVVQISDGIPSKKIFAGDKFAVASNDLVKYWVCTAADGWATSNYVEGLESPANYPNAFAPAEDIGEYENLTSYYSISEVTKETKIAKGQKFAIKSGYWEYYTCIKELDNTEGLYSKFDECPGYFVRGLPVGNAVPSRGKWSFYCSGVWFGSYEVRRNYETDELNAEWEDRGISFSRNDAASNTSISGTEEDEECFLRLFLTRSRRLSNSNLISGFPQDGCANRLIVDGYKHDMVLRAAPVYTDEVLTSVEWECDDLVQPEWRALRTVKDWSWAAFSNRNGYPLHCCVFQQRLVFAATEAQPLSVWFSRIDDINNFLVGDVDDAAMALTLSAPSQNPICWMQAQDDRLMLGTSTTEYSISSSSQNLAFSSTTARARAHSHVGSAEVPAVAAISKAVFIERGSGRVHEYGWNEESGGYIPRELSIFAPHIGAEHGGFVYPTLLTKPDVVLVWTLADGQLALCTYNTMQEVRAWHRWVTDGHILSACALPDGQHEDRLYLVVKRREEAESEVVNIEVVDKESGYVDCGGRDYESTVVTNPLMMLMQEYVGKRNDNHFWIRFGSPLVYQQGMLEVSNDGTTWLYPDWMDSTVSGWMSALGWSQWQFEKVAGIRAKGETGCHILGIQG